MAKFNLGNLLYDSRNSMNEPGDIVSAFIGCYPHIFELIFRLLDPKSLARAECVCKKWQEGILQRKIWKKILFSRIIVLPTWPSISQWIDTLPNDEDLDLKQRWVAIYCQNLVLEKNWQSASFAAKEKIPSQVNFFAMNSTHILTTEGDVIKFWNRRTLQCDKEYYDKGRNIVGIDCDDNYFITTADRDCTDHKTEGSVISIVCRNIKTDDTVFRVVEGPSVIYQNDHSWGCHEAYFKVRFNHNLLVSHRLIQNTDERENPEASTISRLRIRKLNGSEIDAVGTTREVSVNASRIYPTYIGHDDKYIVLHYHYMPRFDLLSADDFDIVRTIDSLDNCSSVQYGNGLIVSASAQMGTHTATTCVIRIWDAETGDCIREIFEPERTRYHNLGHQVAFNSRFIVSVPDLPQGVPRIMKIRDLRAALDPTSTSDQLLLATHTLDWSRSTWDCIAVDEFQILYFHDPAAEPSSFFVLSLLPCSEPFDNVSCL